MSPLGIICWALLLLIGLPMALFSFQLYVVNRNLRDLDRLEQTGFITLRFDEIPWIVTTILRGHRRIAMENGFAELVTFTRTGYGSPNYSCILLSPDRTTFAEIEYVNIAPFFLLLFIFFSPKDFLRSVFGLHGMVLSTEFEDHFRLTTTGYKFLAEQKVNQKEFQVVARSLPFRDKLRAHEQRVAAICAERNTKPTRFDSAEQYLDFERRVLKKLVQQSRSDMESALTNEE